MNNEYISVVVVSAEGEMLNPKVFINNMDLSLGWKLVAKHPNKNADYEEEPLFVSLL